MSFDPLDDGAGMPSPAESPVIQVLIYRNFIGVSACLMLFGTFATLGPALRYTVTAPVLTF